MCIALYLIYTCVQYIVCIFSLNINNFWILGNTLLETVPSETKNVHNSNAEGYSSTGPPALTTQSSPTTTENITTKTQQLKT